MKGIRAGILIMVLACGPLFSLAQQVEEKLIASDAGDSVFLKAFRSTFDTSGNYYFETLVKPSAGKFGLFTNKKNYPAVYAGSVATTDYKSLIADAFFSDTSRKKIFYKNKNGTRLYGPVAGKVREVLEFGKENIAIEICEGAKSRLYINELLVNTIDSSRQQWLCNFSENGNVIYTYYTGSNYRLYVNRILIDSSAEPFSEVSVNDHGFYIYAKKQGNKYLVRTSKKTFGPFGAAEHSDLWNHNGYYFTGCADSMCYVLVNDKLYDKIPEAHTTTEDGVSGITTYRGEELILVEPLDAEHYIFSYNTSAMPGTFINMNGKVQRFNYDMTSFLFCDKKGGVAFYGIRTDSVTGAETTFRNFNGVEKRVPIFKNKVSHRKKYLQIDAGGGSLYYVETRDSVYMFRDDKLLCDPSPRQKFGLWDASVLPQGHLEGTEYFQGININGSTYLVYNNTISKPLTMMYPDYDRISEHKKGSIVAGDISSKGFFVIECTSPGHYLLVINNKEYREFSGIDRIFGEQAYFTDHAIIFYGTKGNSFYEFKVKY